MRARITKVMAGIVAVTALAVGGATFASAASKSQPAKAPVTAVDPDNVQQGDQTSPDKGAAAEQPGESGSEVGGNDGSGGHADEPGNPNADYQFQGEQ